ncbi:hypothetical protein Vi05172_g10756 [Venturia inaequalis]|nr:hypothetical protein Vi05172_g10756 [Venturia inaequalis]
MFPKYDWNPSGSPRTNPDFPDSMEISRIQIHSKSI